MTNLTSFENATGKIPYPLTNDYLFRAFLQENQKALTGLISSLFHLNPSEIQSITITNPIELGKSIDAKDFIFDISIELKPDKIILLEMQVSNELNWTDRSLSYLCRKFDHVAKGCNYTSVTPVYQVSFLDFTLFQDHVRFYSSYQLADTKDHYVYSSKFELRVVDLTHIDLATKEDKAYHIDQWASFFKATTWEAIKMLAKENEYIQSATETIFKLSADEKIRQQCEAREEYYRLQRGMQEQLDSAMAELTEMNNVLAKKDNALAEKDNILAEKDKLIATLQAQLAE